MSEAAVDRWSPWLVGPCPGVAVELYGEGVGRCVSNPNLTSSPPVQRLNRGSGETPTLVTKLLRPVQEEHAETLATPWAPSEGTGSSRH